MLRITSLSLPLEHDPDYPRVAARHLGVPPDAVLSCRLRRRAVDARRKDDIRIVVTLDVSVRGDEAALARRAAQTEVLPTQAQAAPARRVTNRGARPVVIGGGPAGLFAALTLAQAGLRPLLLERGQDVEARRAAVRKFWTTGVLDPENNVQFGAGGAGTFSDGKLNTGTKDARAETVLEAFVRCGAPEDILWQAKPHIGTDRLSGVVTGLRREIEKLGGEVLFGAKADGLITEGGRLRGVRVVIQQKSAMQSAPKEVNAAIPHNTPAHTLTIETGAVILAIGHSARDTFEMLLGAGVEMAAKPFSVGARIEHPQPLIDRAQYGRFAGHKALGAAEYKLSCHLANGRGVYTFCMCPGGQVVAAASETGGVVTNGMSNFLRDGERANSAVLVDVRPEDFGGDPLRGMAFQREIEQAAYRLGGGGYIAPAQRVRDFIAGNASVGIIETSYLPGTAAANLSDCLPPFVSESLKSALPLLGQRLRGFDGPEAVLIGVETRSSCPARIPRDTSGQASLGGLFPAGEGAGYAGGILSAAVDGIRQAEQVIHFVEAQA